MELVILITVILILALFVVLKKIGVLNTLRLKIGVLNPFRLKVVELSNGKYAIKRGILSSYKDLSSVVILDDYWWGPRSAYFKDCQSSLQVIQTYFEKCYNPPRVVREITKEEKHGI